MKKIFSLFAAVLFAGSLMAEVFTLVKDASVLQAGDEIIIVNKDTTKALSTTQNTNNRGAADVTRVDETIEPGSTVQVITLEASGANWKLKVGTDQYLYAAGGTGTNSKNNMKTAAAATAGDNGVFSIAITATGEATITAQGDADATIIRYNPNEKNGNPLFSCYKSTSSISDPVRIFKKGSVAPAAVATPTFSPAANTYNEAKDITIACATEGAAIYYTMDGTEPTSSSTAYTGAIKLEKEGEFTIKAIAIKGSDKSAIATAVFKIVFPKAYTSFEDMVDAGLPTGTLITVTFSDVKLTNVYVNGQGKFHGIFIDVQDPDDNDLEIYYKTVEVPATWGLGGKISGTIEGTWTYYDKESQWEIVPSATDWQWTSLTYTAPTVEAPRLEPLAGSFYGELDITMTCATEGAKIYYILAATGEPNVEYTAPIKLTETTVIRAIAVKGTDNSELVYKKYTMGTTFTCANAAEKALSVAANNTTYKEGDVEEFSVVGYVTKIQTAWASKKISFWVDDEKGDKTTIEAYNCAVENKDDAPNIGDKVRVIGKLTKYNTTPEFAAGCTMVMLEKDVPAVNLGAKTIAEFLALKNKKDTCVLTGTVSNIVMDEKDNTKYNQYGNFDLTDESGTVYVYGLLNSAGEKGKFNEMGIDAGTKITIKAIYYEYVKDAVGTPQAMNAILVSINSGTAIDNTTVETKAVKRIENGMLVIEKDGVRYNAFGQVIR